MASMGVEMLGCPFLCCGRGLTVCFINNARLAVQPVSTDLSLKSNCSFCVPPVDASFRLCSLFSSFIAGN